MKQSIKLGRFAVTRRLGRGGMGAVYEGHDAALDRRVAIKTLTSDDISDPESRARFEREARAAAKLQHPNIVTMYELGNFGSTERPYIVMEFLEGIDLAKAMREQPVMPLSEILGVTVQLCRALDFAHRHGVVHRDMKPANVRYLDNGQIKIMDFGIARLEGSKPITQSGVMVGTLQYMSPEQIKGESLDGRSDLFSVGCILYEMLAGSRPFGGDSATSILYRIVHDEPTPILEANPDLPQELGEILRRALSKSADGRFASAEEMAAEIEKLASIHRKASRWIRPEAREKLDRLEQLRRDGKWSEVLALSESIMAQDGDVVGAYRALRQARRMVAVQQDAAGDEQALQEQGEIARELSHLYGTSESTTGGPAGRVGLETHTSPTNRPTTGVPVWAWGIAAAVVAVLLAAFLMPRGEQGRQEESLATSESSAVPAEDAVADSGTLSRPGSPNIEQELRVSSTPSGAAIVVNGEDSGLRTGSSPVDVALAGAVGETFTLRLTLRGFSAAEHTVVLSEQAPEPWKVSLSARTTSVRLTSEPAGARVEMDGRVLPEPTPVVLDWELGRAHKIVLRKQGYLERTVRIAEGGEPPSGPIAMTRARRNGTLRVASDYGVSVRLGEREILAIDSGPTVPIPAGSHTLRLLAPSVFLSQSVTVEIQEDTELSISTPAVGRISIKAEPSNCAISISGFPPENPPILNRQIAAGVHRVVFTWPDGSTEIEAVQVQLGKPSFVIGRKP